MTPSAQRLLAQWLAGTAEGFGEPARAIARQSLLDTLAVSFAGASEAVNGKVADYVATMHSDSGPRAWLTGDAFQPETSALANAVAAHALDYDDVTPAWRGHPGAVMWPALFAVKHSQDCTFGELLDAFIAGFEVGAQLGENIGARHYAAGWHATATIGVIAATAACARALRLNVEEAFDALGLAAAQSAGLQSNFGTMAKPLQAGLAASAAVRSALLARAGVRSGDALEGANGFSSLYGGADVLNLSLPRSNGGDGRTAIERHGIEVKQFANCYATHRAVEAALAARADIGGDSTQVVAVEIEGTPSAHKPLLDRLPSNVEESRFSAEFAVALALTDGVIRLASFDDGALRRPEISRLMGVSRVSETAQFGPERAGRVVLQLVDGRRVERTVRQLPGNWGDPFFMNRLREKVRDCLVQAGVEQHAQEMFDLVVHGDAAQAASRIDALLGRAAADLSRLAQRKVRVAS